MRNNISIGEGPWAPLGYVLTCPCKVTTAEVKRTLKTCSFKSSNFACGGGGGCTTRPLPRNGSAEEFCGGPTA